MSCRRVRRRLTMEGERVSEVSGHLFLCRDCREEAQRLAAEDTLIREAFGTLPISADFTERVLARIREERRP